MLVGWCLRVDIYFGRGSLWTVVVVPVKKSFCFVWRVLLTFVDAPVAVVEGVKTLFMFILVMPKRFISPC